MLAFPTLAIAAAIGVIIGLVLGLTGAGGSVFAVPLLVLLLGLTPNDAIGLALAVVACSAAYGVWQRRKDQQISWVPAIIFAVTGFITAPMGKWLSSQSNEYWLLAGFNLLAITIAVRMWRQATHSPEAAKTVRASKQPIEEGHTLLCRFNPQGRFELKPRCISGLAVGGLITGLLSGLFGVGGGFIVVPMLNMLTGMTLHRAVATSLVIIAIVSSSGFATHLLISPNFNWHLLSLLVASGIAGMTLGSHFSRRLAGANLQKVFSGALILVSLTSLLRASISLD